MRMLIWHMDTFVAEPTERGRSPVAVAEPQTVRVDNALVVFAAAEEKDEAEPEEVATRATTAIEKTAKQLGVQTIVLHSFAHLFVEKLAAPAIAQQILTETQAQLEVDGYSVSQTAFGWFNRLEIRAKGHPLSRLARQV
jgi:Archaea-specific editing domain of threonyl-tRNA synthetase